MLRQVEGRMGAPQMQQRSLLAGDRQGIAERFGGIGQMVGVQSQSARGLAGGLSNTIAGQPRPSESPRKK